MSVSFEFLRGVLGIIGVGCAYMAGRSLLAVRRGWHKVSTLYGWILRALLCLGAIVFRYSVDSIAIIVWALSALLFTAGYWQAMHQKPPEDLSQEIFPHKS
jgi:hypothetical protein